MIDISAIVITRNEEENIEKCIKNLNFTKEIIVIDNISQDATIDIARKTGAKVFEIAGLDFSYLRNYGKEKSTHEWLLYIDADEVVSPNLSKEIMKSFSDSRYSAYYLIRKNYFLGQLWPKSEKMLRLIKKEALIGWQGILHETPIVTGNIGILKNPLLHYTHKDLSKMVIKTNEWSEIEAQIRFNNNHPFMNWWRFFRIIISSFWHTFFQEMGYKAGVIGIIESIYQAFSTFITYAKLWEKQNKFNISSQKIK